MMTILCGLCSTFSQLLVARMGVGVGEACLAPASLSLVADYFASERRGRAIGIMMTGSSIGAAASVMIGGALVTLLSGRPALNWPLLGERSVWQSAFIIVGLSGLAVGLMLMFLRDDRRQSKMAHHRVASVEKCSPTARPGNRLLVLVYSGFACNLVIAYGSAIWLPVALVRIHHMPALEVGVLTGVLTLILGPSASVAGGAIGDRLAVRWGAAGRLRLAVVALLPVVPTGLAVGLVSAPQSIIIAIGLMIGVANFLSAVSYAILNDLFPPKLRGRSVALYLVVGNVLGQGGGPLSIAVLTEQGFGDETQLPQSIAIIMVAAGLVAMACFVAAIAKMRRDAGPVISHSAAS